MKNCRTKTIFYLDLKHVHKYGSAKFQPNPLFSSQQMGTEHAGGRKKSRQNHRGVPSGRDAPINNLVGTRVVASPTGVRKAVLSSGSAGFCIPFNQESRASTQKRVRCFGRCLTGVLVCLDLLVLSVRVVSSLSLPLSLSLIRVYFGHDPVE